MPLFRIRKHLSNKQRSKASEKEAARFFKGKVQPASGALKCARLKADVKTDKFLIDDKISAQKGFRVTLKLWRKLSNEAWTINKRPLLRIHLEGATVLFVLDEQTLEELI